MTQVTEKMIEACYVALGDFQSWSHQCHAASLTLVRSGALPSAARVARGWCYGVRSQHSWVVLGDPYDPAVTVLDPTLWSYCPEVPVGVWVGGPTLREHRPHGWGDIWRVGRPRNSQHRADDLRLTSPRDGWTVSARTFLELLGPLDLGGWAALANLPVGGWPAKEILGQYDASGLSALLPIDVATMVLHGGYK